MASAGSVVVNLIARTREFVNGMDKAGRSTKKFGKDVSSIGASIESLNRIVSAAVVGNIVRGLADGVSAFAEASREGKDSLVAFTEALPILGGIEKSFAGMLESVSGLKQELEGVSGAVKAVQGLTDFRESLTRQTQLLGAESAGEKQRLTALFKYQDTLEKISEQENLLKEAKKLNPDVLIPNLQPYRDMALKVYEGELEQINNSAAKQLEDRLAYLKDLSIGGEILAELSKLDREFNFTPEQFKQIEKLVEEIYRMEEALKGVTDQTRKNDSLRGSLSGLSGSSSYAGIAEGINLAQMDLSGMSLNAKPFMERAGVAAAAEEIDRRNSTWASDEGIKQILQGIERATKKTADAVVEW